MGKEDLLLVVSVTTQVTVSRRVHFNARASAKVVGEFGYVGLTSIF